MELACHARCDQPGGLTGEPQPHLHAALTGCLLTTDKPRRISAPKRIAFRDPIDPTKTWHGRGRPPKWLQNYLDAGCDKSEFVTE